MIVVIRALVLPQRFKTKQRIEASVVFPSEKGIGGISERRLRILIFVLSEVSPLNRRISPERLLSSKC